MAVTNFILLMAFPFGKKKERVAVTRELHHNPNIASRNMWCLVKMFSSGQERKIWWG
jgi:hypothetical protein